MDRAEIENLYEQLVALSERAFDQQLYETAFHTLNAALHCAFVLSDEERLRRIEMMAREQSAWIDTHDPHSILATPITGERSGSNPPLHPAIFAPSRHQILSQFVPYQTGGANGAVGDLRGDYRDIMMDVGRQAAVKLALRPMDEPV